jgi:transcription antitermination factor NusA-like protein
LARIPKKGSMVIVKWKNGDTAITADQICRGKYNIRLKGIKNELKGEKVNIYEWCDDPEEFILRCLWPLKKSDVASIDLNDENNAAIIIVNNLRKIPKVLRNYTHLGLIESVTQRSLEFREKPK